MSEQQHKPSFIDMTVEIVSSFVSQNRVSPQELPDLVTTVHAALAGLAAPKVEEPPVDQLKPAVPVKKSITDSYLICLDDGRKFKSLKRHLAVLGMTPGEYRAKWGLGADYPMTAPGYSAKRSELALKTGLGTKRQGMPDPEPETAVAPAKKPRAKAAALKQAA